MKLLNAELVLKREEDIQHTEVEYDVIKELGDKTVRYAILSHRWEDNSEVTYEEMIGLMNVEERKRNEVRDRSGYQKIIKTCEQARKDGYEWLWIDTCCIDKRSSAELSEAINSMYRWYHDAQVCYAYLNDMEESTFPTERNVETYNKSRGWPEWFMRGWTLQELIAPGQIEFFNKDWAPVGNKKSLAPVLGVVTNIPCNVLRDGLAGKRLSVAQIMSWAAHRKTTRVEDRAYSLMGLFEVNMPMVYGEGKKAFHRLQLEIIRTSGDHSIFAWDPQMPHTGSVLADDPSDFRCCMGIRRVEANEFCGKLVEQVELSRLGRPWCTWLKPRKTSTNPIHHCRLALLKRHARALSEQLRTFTVSSAGIHVCLPVIPLPDSPSHFRAILACTNNGPGLVTIDIVFSGSSFHMIPINDVNFGKALKAYPGFKTLHLAHNRDVNEKRRMFTLDDKHASYHGFTRRGSYPHKFTGDTVTLSSLMNGLVVVVYANKDAGSYFAVGLGYYLGQGWVHVVYDEHHPTEDVDWANFGQKAHDRMWHARAEHARNMSKQEHAHRLARNTHFVKHAHLPRSVWAVKVVWGRWELDNFRVMVDVEQCPGCCDGPCGMMTTLNDWDVLGMPGLMNTVCRPYSLKLDGWLAEVDGHSGQRTELGDYGDCSDGILMRTGNIFEDMQIIGLDPEDSAYHPVISHASADIWVKSRMRNQADVAIATHTTRHTRLALHQAKGISFPTNELFVLLLKALSTRLMGKHLVTTIIQCSDIYSVDQIGNRIGSGDVLVPDNGACNAETGIFTPFCGIASPQVWRREPPCVQRREQFKSIREHFYALYRPTKTARSHRFPNGRKNNRLVKFFSDIFGLEYLRNYIGEITFLARFSRIMETDSPSDISSLCATEEDGLLENPPILSRTTWAMGYNLLGVDRQFNTAQLDARHEATLPLLHQRCQTLRACGASPRRYTAEKQKVECELRSISQTLGVGLLEHTAATFEDVYLDYSYGRAISQANNIDYDRQLNASSVVQEIEALQMKLDATEDEDEQRALEEDVTGKILWLCWCGICAEVEELLPKVVSYFLQREENAKDLVEMCKIMTPIMYALDPSSGVSSIYPGDEQAHLRRIMLDAETHTSKHQLLLAARAAEQAKWSGANKGTLATDNQGTTPNTSSQAPSESVV